MRGAPVDSAVSFDAVTFGHGAGPLAMAEAFALGSRVGVEAGVLVVCDAPARVIASPDPRVRRLLDSVARLPETPA